METLRSRDPPRPHGGGRALAPDPALAWPIPLCWSEPERTAFMEHRLDQNAGLDLRHEWVPLGRISPHLRRAVITAEDGRFYEHDGIDWNALADELHYTGDADFSWLDADDLRAVPDAIQYYHAHRDQVRGRSTITQQLAKNLYFGPERSILRKVNEFVVARRLEWFLTKDRILELYLNIAEWGPGRFGAEAAARHYFGRSAADLTRDQAAALAATLPHPLTSNPAHHPSRMAWRKPRILEWMGGSAPAPRVPLAPPPAIEIPDPDIPETELDETAPDPALPDPIPPAILDPPPADPPYTARAAVSPARP